MNYKELYNFAYNFLLSKEGVTDEIIQNIMDRHKMEKVDWKLVKRIGLLGVDEIAQEK